MAVAACAVGPGAEAGSGGGGGAPAVDRGYIVVEKGRSERRVGLTANALLCIVPVPSNLCNKLCCETEDVGPALFTRTRMFWEKHE